VRCLSLALLDVDVPGFSPRGLVSKKPDQNTPKIVQLAIRRKQDEWFS
jgi:hypothetical protein